MRAYAYFWHFLGSYFDPRFVERAHFSWVIFGLMSVREVPLESHSELEHTQIAQIGYSIVHLDASWNVEARAAN